MRLQLFFCSHSDYNTSGLLQSGLFNTTNGHDCGLDAITNPAYRSSVEATHSG